MLLRMAEKAGDRLLSLAVPRVKARAYYCVHCTGPYSQVCNWSSWCDCYLCTSWCQAC